VDHRQYATVHVDREAFGELESVVVVAPNGVDELVGGMRRKRVQHRRIGDVARMQDHVRRDQLAGEACQESIGLTPTEVGVSDHENVRRHGGSIWSSPDCGGFGVVNHGA
jgi:hypothetical protein